MSGINEFSEELWHTISEKQLDVFRSTGIPIPKLAIFLMGIPASGKNTIINNFLMNYTTLDLSHFVIIDPDLMMEYLDGYNGSKAADFNKMGVILSSKIMNYTLLSDFSFIYFGTGKNYKQYESTIKKAKKNGFFTVLINVEIDKSIAKIRSSKRALKTGRSVSSKVINNINNRLKNTSKNTRIKKHVGKTNFTILKELSSVSPKILDYWIVYNNNTTPIVVDKNF